MQIRSVASNLQDGLAAAEHADLASSLVRFGFKKNDAHTRGRAARSIRCLTRDTAPSVPFGARDQAGNVVEWCQDWYSSSYYSVSPPTDPPGPTAGVSRVERGGGWGSDAFALRSADSRGSDPSSRVSLLGFRPARESHEY